MVSWNTRRGSGQNSRSCSGRREVTAPDTAGHGRARRRCAHLVLGVRVGVVPQKFAAESSARRVRRQPQRAESRRRAGGLRRLDSSTSRTGRLPGSKTAPVFDSELLGPVRAAALRGARGGGGGWVRTTHTQFALSSCGANDALAAAHDVAHAAAHAAAHRECLLSAHRVAAGSGRWRWTPTARCCLTRRAARSVSSLPSIDLSPSEISLPFAASPLLFPLPLHCPIHWLFHSLFYLKQQQPVLGCPLPFHCHRSGSTTRADGGR